MGKPTQVKTDTKKSSKKEEELGNPLLAPGKAFTIAKTDKHGSAYLCSQINDSGETKLQFKTGWLWHKRFKDSDECFFFYDKWSKTFINVAQNDKSVLVSDQRN
jgi:hypothetical protein